MNFFIITINELNGCYMVHSKCEQLQQCFACKGMKEAEKVRSAMDVIANRDYELYKDVLNLTWC